MRVIAHLSGDPPAAGRCLGAHLVVTVPSSRAPKRFNHGSSLHVGNQGYKTKEPALCRCGSTPTTNPPVVQMWVPCFSWREWQGEDSLCIAVLITTSLKAWSTRWQFGVNWWQQLIRAEIPEYRENKCWYSKLLAFIIYYYYYLLWGIKDHKTGNCILEFSWLYSGGTWGLHHLLFFSNSAAPLNSCRMTQFYFGISFEIYVLAKEGFKAFRYTILSLGCHEGNIYLNRSKKRDAQIFELDILKLDLFIRSQVVN